MALSMNERALLDWLAIRIAYERGTESVDAVAAHWGISTANIHTMARNHGWLRRRERYRGIDTGPPGALSDDIILKERLKRIVEKKLDRIEQEAAKPDEEARDTNGEARLANELLRSYERMDRVATRTRAAAAPAAEKKVTAPGAAAAAGKKRSTAAVATSAPAITTTAEDDDRWAQDLAGRIERLRKTWEQ